MSICELRMCRQPESLRGRLAKETNNVPRRSDTAARKFDVCSKSIDHGTRLFVPDWNGRCTVAMCKVGQAAKWHWSDEDAPAEYIAQLSDTDSSRDDAGNGGDCAWLLVWALSGGI